MTGKTYNIKVNKEGENLDIDYKLPEVSTDALVIVQMLNTRLEALLRKQGVTQEDVWELVARKHSLSVKVNFSVIEVKSNKLEPVKLNVDLARLSKTSLSLLYMAVIELLTS